MPGHAARLYTSLVTVLTDDPSPNAGLPNDDPAPWRARLDLLLARADHDGAITAACQDNLDCGRCKCNEGEITRKNLPVWTLPR